MTRYLCTNALWQTGVLVLTLLAWSTGAMAADASPVWRVLESTHGGTVHLSVTEGLTFKADAPDAVLQAACELPLEHPTSYDLLGRINLSGGPRETLGTLHVAYRDIFGRPLKKTGKYGLSSLDSKPSFSLPLPIPDLAATVRVTLEYRPKTPSASLRIHALKLRQRARASDDEAFARGREWGAHWIWISHEVQTDHTAYFRHVFEVSDPREVASAIAVATADDVCRVYINGHELPPGPGAEDWLVADQYDLQPFLRAGENVLGIKATNHAGAAGVLAEVAIRMKDGALKYIPTDATWRCSKNIQPGWSDPTAVNDGQWAQVADLGSPPSGPWGDQAPYFYHGPASQLVVEPLDIPSAATPGDGLTMRIQLHRVGSDKHARKSPRAPANDAPRAPIPASAKDPLTLMLSLSPALDPETPSIQVWHATVEGLDSDQTKIVTIHASLPAYLPGGSYYLLLRASGHTHFVLAEDPHDAAGVRITDDNALAIALNVAANTASIDHPTVTIDHNRARPILRIDGKRHTLMHYMNITTPISRRAIRHNRDNGIHLYFLNAKKIGMPGSGPEAYWAVDRMLTLLLKEDPQAYVVLVVALDPIRRYSVFMDGWMEKHPDQLVKDAKGNTTVIDRPFFKSKAPSLASPVWRQRAEQLLRGLIRHVRGQRYATHVIGYMPASGESWEWQYWGYAGYVDYSEPYQHGFQQWLKEQYGTIARLNAAWPGDYQRFDQIVVPPLARQKHSDLGDLLDPTRSRDLIDLRRFHSELEARDILDFSRIVKDETDGQSLCGVFYGYVTYVLPPHRFAFTGHFASHMLLDSPAIDFLMSPARYQDRQMGGASGSMMADSSVHLHDKLWIQQADIRTVNSPLGSAFGRVDTLADTAAVLEREFARTLITGGALQTFDFGRGWTVGDPRLMQIVGRMRDIADQLQTRDTSKVPAPGKYALAFITDESSTFYTAEDSNLHMTTVREQYPVAYHSGVGIRWYLLSDLDKIADQYKGFVFLNTVRITPAQRGIIEKLKRDGNVLVFIYAPGVTDGKHLDVDLMSQVTGFKFSSRPYDGPLHVKLDSTQETYGTNLHMSPLFVPQGGHVAGQLVEKPGLPGLVIQKHDDWTAIYSAAPVLSPALIEQIARLARVRVTNRNKEDVTYVGNRLLAIHTIAGGKRQVTLAAKDGTLVNPLTHEHVSIGNHTASITLPPRSTSLFLVRTGDGAPDK